MSFARKLRWLGNCMVPDGARMVGYAALAAALDLERPVPEPCATYDKHTRKSEEDGWRIVSARQAPEDSLAGHLDFAMRHERVNLPLLKALFRAVSKKDIAAYVTHTRTGIPNRRTWFLYEWLTGERLDVPDLNAGNYVGVLDASVYHTRDGELSRRHRVRDNLIGTPAFCPIIRHTEDASPERLRRLERGIQEILTSSPEALLRRATNSLLFGETLSTFAIEGIRPDRNALTRWGGAIQQAGRRELTEAEIVRLQQLVLPEGYNDEFGFRTKQNFVGSIDRSYRPAPERVNPRPEDVQPLMGGWLEWISEHSRSLDPVVAAAVASFSFVYIHPLMDGNGRLHRYLLHHVLADRRFTPAGMVFPVSLPLLEKGETYKSVLSDFDNLVMPYTRWQTNEMGGVDVLNDVSDLYRYTDLTQEAEFIYDCVEKAAIHHYKDEIHTIASLDHAMESMARVADLSDERLRDFIMFARQNKNAPNRLPNKRAKKEFSDLDRETIEKMEAILDRTLGGLEETPDLKRRW